MRLNREKEAVSATVAGTDDTKKGAPTRLLFGYQSFLFYRVIAVAITFVFNVAWLIWAKVQYGIVGNIGTIQRGDCDAIENLNTRLHVIINVLTTIVLAASTTFMILAYSPSRPEINAAHARHKRLSAGSIGFRNLKYISREKMLIYVILVLSSVPLHLL
jgi:hypothetical protein